MSNPDNAQPVLAPIAWAKTTLCRAFLDTVARRADAVAFNIEGAQGWYSHSFAEYHDLVARTVTGLRALGVMKDDRVLILMRNRLEHHVIDLACVFIGAIPVPIYFSSSPTQLTYLANHCRARLAVADDAAALQRLVDVGAKVPNITAYIIARGEAVGATNFNQLVSGSPADLVELAAQVQNTDTATIIYTSGTTGNSKAVPVTHRGAQHAVARFQHRWGESFEGWRAVCYAPLAHSGERCFTHWSQMMFGLELTDCPELSELGRYAVVARPNLWFAAPRLWEKRREAIEASFVNNPVALARFEAARGIGLEMLAFELDGNDAPAELAQRWAAAREADIAPVLAMWGLQDVRVAIAGSAATSVEMQRWWLSVGLCLSDAYGSTEMLITTWDPSTFSRGTIGTPLADIEVRLADDGELLVRGPFPFPGYMDPEVGSTNPVDAQGWYATGDLVVAENGGRYRIVDRKKDIIVPSSGHNVSPVSLESALKEHPLISQACVVGDGRPYCGALLVLDPDIALAALRQQGVTDASSITESQHINRIVTAHLIDINTRFARSEQIGTFELVTESWVPATVFLTDTGKMKRASIRGYYANLIERMYAVPDIRTVRTP